MLYKFLRLRVRYQQGILFLGSWLFCLWLGQFPATIVQSSWGEIAIASNESQLVQQGVES